MIEMERRYQKSTGLLNQLTKYFAPCACKRIPGKQILFLLFWLRLTLSSFYFFMRIIYYRLIFRSALDEILKRRNLPKYYHICTNLTLWPQFLLIPLYLHCLWTGIKQNSKHRFEAALILAVINVLISHGVGLGAMYAWFSTGPLRLFEIFNIVFSILLPLFLSITEIYFLKKYSRQLGSLLMEQVVEHYQEVEAEEQFVKGKVDLQSPNGIGLDFEILPTPHIDLNVFKKFVIPPYQITIEKSNLLGEGFSSVVTKGYIRRGGEFAPIALKTVKDVKHYMTCFVKEIKILIHVSRHKNIVSFFGITSNASLQGNLSIVMEYCLGSLKEFLVNNRDMFSFQDYLNIHQNYIGNKQLKIYGLMDLVRVSLEVADGMQYLVSKKVVHGDLACRNILLSNDLSVKITDFGIAHRMYDYQVYQNFQKQKTESYAIFPWRWSAIEVLKDLKFSEKSDMWSYGVLLWEIFTLGDQPFEGLDWSTNICNELRNGLRLNKPDAAPQEIYGTMLQCWEPDFNQRPTFKDTHLHISNMYSSTPAVCIM